MEATAQPQETRGGTTVLRLSSSGRDLRPRLAQLQPTNNACATASTSFRANMDDARFWIWAADRLAAAGDEENANKARAEAEYYLGLAEQDLAVMGEVCG
jgi:predicted Zn-dependent protease